MKYVFDWEAFGGCLGMLVVLALIPIGAFVVYFIFNAILFILPAIVAGAIILAIPVGLFYAFKEMVFKKVE
ncbi:MAG: hypothetical protein E7050_04855 [Lentisphaerae bacterium]|nr:hypothetical protein [Lentisphaerota bacterium]